MLPAQQGFGLTYVALTNVQLGLVMQQQLALVGRVAKVADQRDLAAVREVTAMFIDLQATGHLRGVFHGDGRAFKQGVRAFAIGWECGDAQTAVQRQVMAVDALGPQQQLLEFVGHAHRLVAACAFEQ